MRGFEVLRVLCGINAKNKNQGIHLLERRFPICKMRELTLYVPVTGFVTCEVASLLV